MSSSLAQGYKMIESLDIVGFRCFQEVELKKLGRLNVVVGGNASGKTALLESIYIAAGAGPAITMNVRGMRGLSGVALPSMKEISRVWKDLFYKLDLRNDVFLQVTDSERRVYGLRIRHEENTKVVISPEQAPRQLPPIKFIFYRNEGEYESVPEVKGMQIELSAPNLSYVHGHLFASQTQLSAQDAAGLFSELSTRKMAHILVDRIKKEFPIIEDLTIETSFGPQMICASVASLPEKIPISFISSGLNKLVSILLAIISSNRGFVAIDEIENGFHYSRLISIWTMIKELAIAFDCQIFASTHSYECLLALAEVNRNTPNDVVMLRTKLEGGVSKVKEFTGDAFIKGLEFGELR